ncbi:MAG: WD40/YVTN/BNR-like repeat-containing protein [Ignavibacteria bacterium]
MKILKLINFSLISLLLIFTLSCKEKSLDPNGQVDYNWQFLGMQGKTVWKLLLDGDYLYAGVEDYGLWRLNVKQPSVKWEHLGIGDTIQQSYDIDAIIVDKETNTIFIGIVGTSIGMPAVGIWKTTNNGLSWIPSDSGIPSPSNSVYSMAQNPLNPNIMFAHCNRGLYKSTDRGKSWRYVMQGGMTIEDIEFYDKNPDTIWIGGESNALYSIYWTSEDGGETWNVGTGRAPRKTLVIYDIEFDPNNSSTVYVGTMGEFLKTTDYGKTWDTLINPICCPYVSANNISINPKNSQELFATGRYLYYSTNGGKSFEKINLPTEYDPVAYALAVDWDRRILYISILKVGIYKKRF